MRQMKAFNSLLLLGVIAVVSTAALAQDSSDEANVEAADQDSIESAPKSEAGPPIESIIVTAQQSFFLLNSQIEYATQRLYSVYSDLNEIEEFDVECRSSDWTGTHIKQQECWPAFFDQIVADNAQDWRMGFG